MSLLKVLISYSHKNEKQKDKLLTHLGVLENAGASLEVWNDAAIGAGENWRSEIEKAISETSIAILLISAEFLTSDFILKKEVPALLNQRQRQGLKIFPIVAKPCAWKAAPWLETMQMRPKDAKPVWRSGGRYADDELSLIAMEIHYLIEKTKTDTLREMLQDPSAKEQIEKHLGPKELTLQRIFDKARINIEEKDADARRRQMESLKRAFQTGITEIRKGRRLIVTGSGHILNEPGLPNKPTTVEYRPEMHLSRKTALARWKAAKKPK